MGRVSKHKRIKACDPFYKGPRRVDPRNDDLPPEAPDDQPMPKTLSRLLKSGQQISQTGKPRRLKQINSQAEHMASGSKGSELTRRRRKRQIEKGNDANSGGSITKGEQQEQPMFKRQRGESLKAYLERIDVESNARIMEAFRRSRKQSDRRKRYYEKRRRRLKGLKEEEELDETAQVVEFDDLKDKVHFGETVQEPPRLAARPRGSAVKETRKNKAHSLLLMNKLESGERKSRLKVGVATGKVEGLKRQRDIEIEREKAIEQYRQIKKARTKHTI